MQMVDGRLRRECEINPRPIAPECTWIRRLKESNLCVWEQRYQVRGRQQQQRRCCGDQIGDVREQRLDVMREAAPPAANFPQRRSPARDAELAEHRSVVEQGEHAKKM